MSRQIVAEGDRSSLWIGKDEARALAVTMELGSRLCEERGALTHYVLKRSDLHRKVAQLLRTLGDDNGGLLVAERRDER